MTSTKRKTKGRRVGGAVSKGAMAGQIAILESKNRELFGPLLGAQARTARMAGEVAPVAPSAICIDRDHIGVLIPNNGVLETIVRIKRSAALYLRDQLESALMLQVAVMESESQAKQKSVLANIDAIYAAGYGDERPSQVR